MSHNDFYVDAMGNIGSLKHMVAYPVIRLKKISRGSDASSLRRIVDHDVMKYAMVMVSGKGVVLDPGYIYDFHIEVLPATPLKGITFYGPVQDIVGKQHNTADNSVFYYNTDTKVKVQSEVQCQDIFVRTRMVLQTDVVALYVKPNFTCAHYSQRKLCLPKLADLLELRHDFELELASGTVLYVVKMVLIARSAAFATMFNFKENIDPNSTNRIKMRTTEYSDDLWRLAYKFMLTGKVVCDSIPVLQDLYKFGDEFQVGGLCLLVVNILRDSVDDGTFVRTNPYLISVLKMSVFYMTRDVDDDLLVQLHELNHVCECVVFNRSHDVMKSSAFVRAYAGYKLYKEQCLGKAECQEDASTVMGQLEWPEPRKRSRA
jgi:hypothetical protein